jgi:hypothetical protein
MPKLTDTQLVILSNAAKRDTGAVLPLPKSLKANKSAASNTIRSLIKRGLVIERIATPDDAIWRETDYAQLTLVITDAGLAAIGIDPVEPSADTNPKPDRKPGKQQILTNMLHRENGANIDELQSALSWQAHSVRGAISGVIKKKLGFAVLSEKTAARGRVYRIVAAGY